MSRDNSFVCPFCGASVSCGAKSCPACGSDERTGWSEGTYLDGIDLPEDVDYEEVAAKEFPSQTRSSPWWISWRNVLGGIILLAFLLLILRSAV